MASCMLVIFNDRQEVNIILVHGLHKPDFFFGGTVETKVIVLDVPAGAVAAADTADTVVVAGISVAAVIATLFNCIASNYCRQC